jgi:hypothetical protein
MNSEGLVLDAAKRGATLQAAKNSSRDMFAVVISQDCQSSKFEIEWTSSSA